MRLLRDRVHRPMEATYIGPYNVIERHPKHFIIALNDHTQQDVSINRSKPAFLKSTPPPTRQETSQSTSSPPKKEEDYYHC